MVDLNDPVALINAHLPPQIRVMCVKRVTKAFSGRFYCLARVYEYVMPTYAFAPDHLTTPNYRMPGKFQSIVIATGLLVAQYAL